MLALESDLEKAAYEREKLDVEYSKKINEERLKCDETVGTLLINCFRVQDRFDNGALILI